jgi:quercetin dioxygenase-like cupin family protein
MRTDRRINPTRHAGRAALVVALCAAVGLPALAHDVIPDHEVAAAQRLQADGPTETVGVDAVTPLGSVPLAGELPGAEGKVLRAREFVLAPGATIAVHEHQQRPGLAYILEGELVEHRSDQQGPIVRGVGAVAFERSGLVHYWKNESGKPVRALVVDIVDDGS